MHMAGESLGCHVSIDDVRKSASRGFSGLSRDGALCGHGRIMRFAIRLSERIG